MSPAKHAFPQVNPHNRAPKQSLSCGTQVSITLGRLRAARARYRRLVEHSQRTGVPLDTRDLEARLLADDADETTLIVGSWEYAGTGWPKPGDAELANAAAARAREYDQWRATQHPARSLR